VKNEFTILFFAPADIKPIRKRRVKAEPAAEGKGGDDAKFAGLTTTNIFGKLKGSKGKAHAVQLEFVDRYWTEIIKTQKREVLALPKAGLLEILQRDELDAKEPDLFQLALEWGRAESKKAGGTAAGDDLKKVLADILPHIRFPTFTATEMALTVTPQRLLTAEQELHLYTHIGKAAGKKAEAPKSDKKTPHVKVAGFIATPRKPFGIYKPATSRFEDNTGIVYWIGTNEGTSGYVNPADRLVGVRMSTSAGSSIPSIFDRNYTGSPIENSYGGDSAPWVEIDFRSYKVRPTSYFLAQEQDHYLRNWRIEGSDDGSSWTTLRDHNNDATLTTSNRWAFFDLKASTFYSRLRLFCYGASHNGSTNFDITEIEFYGYVTKLA